MKPRVPTHKAVKFLSCRASQEDSASWCIRNIKNKLNRHKNIQLNNPQTYLIAQLHFYFRARVLAMNNHEKKPYVVMY
jgi:hypothetical protein